MGILVIASFSSQSQQQPDWVMYYQYYAPNDFLMLGNDTLSEYGLIEVVRDADELRVPDSATVSLAFAPGVQYNPYPTTGRRGNQTSRIFKCCLRLKSGKYRMGDLLSRYQGLLPGLKGSRVEHLTDISTMKLSLSEDMLFEVRILDVFGDLIEIISVGDGVLNIDVDKPVYKEKGNYPLMIKVKGIGKRSTMEYELVEDIFVLKY